MHAQDRQARHSGDTAIAPKSAFNCVTAAVYNYITTVHRVIFPIEYMYPMQQMLQVYNHEDYLVTVTPDDMLRRFLERTGAWLEFPAVEDIDDAIDYADRHLRDKGPLSVNVNLRYDILEPLSFDNDSWHYQLIVGRSDDGGFAMYDQFEDLPFVYPLARFRQAIDTPFNYRHGGRFTPFMQVMFDDLPRSRERLCRQIDLLPELAEGIAHYPLQRNIDEGLRCIEKIARFAAEKPGAEFMYRIMNSHLIISKTRLAVADYLQQRGIDSDALRQLARRWLQYKDVLGLTLMRRDAAEFERLAGKYRELITFEQQTLAQALTPGHGSTE